MSKADKWMTIIMWCTVPVLAAAWIFSVVSFLNGTM